MSPKKLSLTWPAEVHMYTHSQTRAKIIIREVSIRKVSRKKTLDAARRACFFFFFLEGDFVLYIEFFSHIFICGMY